MNMLNSGLADDPPKYGRFGDQILRSQFGARSDAKPVSALLIALRAKPRAEGMTYGH